MLKFFALAAGLMLASAASAQQSLEAMHARVPAPPATAAAAPAWLASPELVALRKQLKDQRTFIEKLSTEAGAAAQPTAAQTGGVIDFQRAQRDPAYAEQVKAQIAAMSQEEKMKLAMQMQQATQQNALKDVKAMAADPEAVTAAADHYADYQANPSTMRGIQAQYAAVADIQQRVRAREAEIASKAGKSLKCSDGEGGCASAADQAADKVTLKAAFDQIIAEYNKALPAIAQQVEAARKSRLAAITAAQADLGPAQYGSAAKSSANRQLLAAYHNAVLIEVEQLMTLTEDAAKWAATRYKDRTINFTKID
ncbi:MAG TPA: hypothetical protein VEW08_05740 [Steroidobacteraceae bacterium]|nr:hypothetical protein [Steroidobacteraceae bacterium]